MVKAQLSGSMSRPQSHEWMPPMTIAIERRSSRRQATVRNAAAVSFKSKGRARLAGATLMDISLSGARLRMRQTPPLNGLLTVRLLSPVPTPAVTAAVVWVGDGGEVGVQFPLGCNQTLFWTATRGEDFGSGRLPRRRVAMERVGL
jgi:hypothetical protein